MKQKWRKGRIRGMEATSSSDRGTVQVFTFDPTISTCGPVHVYRMTPSQHTPHLPRGEARKSKAQFLHSTTLLPANKSL